MKKLSVFLCAMVLVFGVVGTARSALWDRGGGLIYDDVLDITWLQDANYAQTSGHDINDGKMTWENAVAWVDGLVYGGYDDWRLPDAHNQDGSGPEVGWDISGSEMGHMFYNNLGGTADSFPGSSFVDGNGKSISFSNLLPDYYWSTPEGMPDPDQAWIFGFQNGLQSHNSKYDDTAVWPVRDGDSSPPPNSIPTLSEWGLITLFILLVGSALWVMRKRTSQESA